MSDSSSPGFSPADSAYMSLALQLAEQGRYSAHPNPRVGCVIVNSDEIVGRGWHACTGEPHAEVNALAEAAGRAKGATAYVTLEPCSHVGKTPPCCDALIKACVGNVICAIRDPNPKVSGRGIEALERAGISVSSGLMEAQAEYINRGYLSRMRFGRPFVRMKMAASIDGATAMRDGQSQWITGKDARADVQRLRAESGAILTGIGTVLADDPSLTVRDEKLGSMQPLRVVVDSSLRMPPSACMLALDGATVVYCARDDGHSRLDAAGATVRKCPADDGRVDLKKLVESLAQQGINDVLVEAGPVLAGNLLDRRLVDELVIYQAPHIMGSETRGMFSTPRWTQLSDRVELTITDVRRIGSDTRITATPGA